MHWSSRGLFSQLQADIRVTKCFHVFNSSGWRQDRFVCKTILGNLYLRRTVIYFQCHNLLISINRPNLQGKVEVSFVLTRIMWLGYALVADTTYCLFSVHFPLPPPHSFPEYRTYFGSRRYSAMMDLLWTWPAHFPWPVISLEMAMWPSSSNEM